MLQDSGRVCNNMRAAESCKWKGRTIAFVLQRRTTLETIAVFTRKD